MTGFVKPAMLILLVPIIFGVVGGVLATNRGRSPVLWSILCALFPICILIVYFEKPVKAVEGKFRKCEQCGEWIKWHESPCHYCQARTSR